MVADEPEDDDENETMMMMTTRRKRHAKRRRSESALTPLHIKGAVGPGRRDLRRAPPQIGGEAAHALRRYAVAGILRRYRQPEIRARRAAAADAEQEHPPPATGALDSVTGGPGHIALGYGHLEMEHGVFAAMERKLPMTKAEARAPDWDLPEMGPCPFDTGARRWRHQAGDAAAGMGQPGA